MPTANLSQTYNEYADHDANVLPPDLNASKRAESVSLLPWLMF
jgi:hypothetical protein